MQPTRDDAWKLLTEYVTSESLRKHCLAVEAAMRAGAVKYGLRPVGPYDPEGSNPDLWGITGLLHDFAFERYPDLHEHATRGAAILREKGYPEEIVRAVLAHNGATGVPREAVMEKFLAAVDELCGFAMATAHVRPTKFEGMTPQSIEKNLKKKGFAEKISREEIDRGIEALGADREEHLLLVIRALGAIAKELGF